MPSPLSFAVGDTLVLKKCHACAKDAFSFTVTMAYSDVKLRCDACGHTVISERDKLEKAVRRVISHQGDTASHV